MRSITNLHSTQKASHNNCLQSTKSKKEIKKMDPPDYRFLVLCHLRPATFFANQECRPAYGHGFNCLRQLLSTILSTMSREFTETLLIEATFKLVKFSLFSLAIVMDWLNVSRNPNSDFKSYLHVRTHVGNSNLQFATLIDWADPQ